MHQARGAQALEVYRTGSSNQYPPRGVAVPWAYNPGWNITWDPSNTSIPVPISESMDGSVPGITFWYVDTGYLVLVIRLLHVYTC
jgi:hypothetical protein